MSIFASFVEAVAASFVRLSRTRSNFFLHIPPARVSFLSHRLHSITFFSSIRLSLSRVNTFSFVLAQTLRASCLSLQFYLSFFLSVCLSVSLSLSLSLSLVKSISIARLIEYSSSFFTAFCSSLKLYLSLLFLQSPHPMGLSILSLSLTAFSASLQLYLSLSPSSHTIEFILSHSHLPFYFALCFLQLILNSSIPSIAFFLNVLISVWFIQFNDMFISIPLSLTTFIMLPFLNYTCIIFKLPFSKS